MSAAGAMPFEIPTRPRRNSLQWTSPSASFARYPEVQGISELSWYRHRSSVPLRHRQVADPAGPLAANGTFAVTPAGNRPYYCFVSATQSRHATPAIPDGIDYCTTSLGPLLLQARDSGQDVLPAVQAGKDRGTGDRHRHLPHGTVPNTVKARRAAFIGLDGHRDPSRHPLDTALADHPSTAVAFHYGTGSSAVDLQGGDSRRTAPSRRRSISPTAGSVQVFGASTDGGFFNNPHALDLLIGGVALSSAVRTVALCSGHEPGTGLVAGR